MKRDSRRDNLPITVGTLAIAVKPSGVCDVGEIGVCYEVYELDGRLGYGFLFVSGRYDGFSARDVLLFLALPNVHCALVSGYRFRNVLQLSADFQAGLFAPAFSMTLPPLELLLHKPH